MYEKLTFKLTRIAEFKGGDRYEHGTKGQSDYIVFYIPQYISRKKDENRHFPSSVREVLTITIE